MDFESSKFFCFVLISFRVAFVLSEPTGLGQTVLSVDRRAFALDGARDLTPNRLAPLSYNLPQGSETVSHTRQNIQSKNFTRSIFGAALKRNESHGNCVINKSTGI